MPVIVPVMRHEASAEIIDEVEIAETPGGSAQTRPIYARLVEDIRAASITSSEIAEITRVKERQVHNWASGQNRPVGETRDRLLEIHYLVTLLREVYTPEGVEVWLHGRNRTLRGQKPIEMLREGSFTEVLDAVERLQVGAM